MKIITTANYDELSKKAANIIAAQILIKPECVLGLATGSSPIGTYERLIKYYNDGDLDFSTISSVNLDEYRGLGPNDDQSYNYFMNEHLFSKVNINKEKTFLPNGLEADADKACSDYNNIIDHIGGIDLQLLGLGHNGHIGFNEPDESFPISVHCVDLTPSTIEANTRFFANEDLVPKQAYTMGVGNILNAKKILVVVSGKDKAAILNTVINGPVTPLVPASILQLHKDVTFVVDEAAASELVK